MKRKLFPVLFAFVIAFGLGSAFNRASAHTISIGSFNAGAPGSVTLVLGTYSHGGGIVQGSVALIAGPGIPPTVGPQAFTTLLLTKPAGLVDGDNNFYADSNGGSIPYGSIAADSYNQATNTVGLGPVVNWQAATFTGLTAGLFTYQLTGMTAANWNNVNSFDPNWTGTLNITGTSTGGTPVIPEPATVALLGIGLAGLVGVGVRRKMKGKAVEKS